MLERIGTQGRDVAPFALVGLFAFMVTWIMRAERHLFGIYGPHAYWASLWATDYRDGFVNRGLLGEIARRIGVTEPNYLVITILTWIVSLALVVVITRAIARATTNVDLLARLCLCVAIMLSPAMDGILIETMGDPILLVLLVHLVIAPRLLDARTSPLLSAAVYAGLGAVMVLVHEASIFFVVPWLGVQAFLVRKTPSSRAALIANGVTSLIVVGFLVVHGFSAGGVDNPVLHFGHQQAVYEGRLAPPFGVLLHEELTRIFGSGVGGYVQTILRLVGATLLPVTLAVILTFARIGAGPGSAPAWRTHALAFLGPAVCLGPLMLIAHDWGRFFAYELMLFVATLAALPASRPEKTDAAAPMAIAGMLIISGLTATSALADYRMDGLFANKHMLIVSVIVIGAFAALILLTRKSSAAQPDN